MVPRSRALVVAAFLVVAGCLGAGGPDAAVNSGTTTTETEGTDTDAASLPHEAVVFDHAGEGSPAVEGGIADGSTDGDHRTRYYASLVASREATDRFDDAVLTAEASAFVTETNFSRSVLAVVQAYPASSAPDYRVERATREGEAVHLRINDSAPGGTADVTVETLLVRLPRGDDPPDRLVVTTETGTTFNSSAGVVVPDTATTTTTSALPTLPYRGDDPAANRDDPLDVRIRNAGPSYNGYRVRLTYVERPDCLDADPPCAVPTREVPVLDRRGKLHPNRTRTIEDVAARTGTYVVTATGYVPARDGGRRTVTAESTWRVNASADDLLVVVSDESVRVRQDD